MQIPHLTYMEGTRHYEPLWVIFKNYIYSSYTSPYIKFNANRMFHVPKITFFRFDLYGRYQTLLTDINNFLKISFIA